MIQVLKDTTVPVIKESKVPVVLLPLLVNSDKATVAGKPLNEWQGIFLEKDEPATLEFIAALIRVSLRTWFLL